ncbi:NAD-binding protein [Lyngbya aestuarii]|uniref:NAD-binding protein n=1 Tax=Lyngbya aestuarii TaxID=118322 RepID=UPI00403E2986
MYLIVVGGGVTACSLTSLAIENGYRVAVIEENAERARNILQKYDVQLFQADIAEGGILEEAGVDKADAIVATTTDDSANLMAMFLGKKYGIKNLVSMVNNNQHQEMFESLGVQVLVNPEAIIAQRLFSFLEQDNAQQ